MFSKIQLVGKKYVDLGTVKYFARTSVCGLCVTSVRQGKTMQVKGKAKTLFWEIQVQPLKKDGIFMGVR